MTMSESPEGEENHSLEGKDEDLEQASDEDDCEGYFLEPAGNNGNIAEKIAEANRKLLEEAEEEEEEGGESRARKVHFNEEPNYYSDDDCTQSAHNSVISEEDLDVKTPEETKIENASTDLEEELEERIPEEIPEDILEEPHLDVIPNIQELTENPKFILVLLPKEQNSSCESIIGEEDIPEEEKEIEEKDISPEPEKPTKTKITRPKSAKKYCEVSKISPDLSYSSRVERKSWQKSRNPLAKPKSKPEGSEKKNVFVGEIKVQIKGNFLKKINIDDLSLEEVSEAGTLKCCGGRPRSSYIGRNNAGGVNRPKTAPMRRTCCVIKTELPQYNGLRSEYGLSEEQLQERKKKSLENSLKKKQEQMRKRQEEVKRRNENEETFQKWLFNKTKKSFKKKSAKVRDTLTRSDVYIQTHASYAANPNVPYSLDYSLSKKIKKKKETRGKKNKTIAIEKLLDNMTPHFKRSFNIYLGVKT